MSIQLPAIPVEPKPTDPADVWARYLSILSLHVNSENTAAIREGVASQAAFMAAMNATPDGVAFGDVLKLVGMLLRMPVEPPAAG